MWVDPVCPLPVPSPRQQAITAAFPGCAQAGRHRCKASPVPIHSDSSSSSLGPFRLPIRLDPTPPSKSTLKIKEFSSLRRRHFTSLLLRGPTNPFNDRLSSTCLLIRCFSKVQLRLTEAQLNTAERGAPGWLSK